jgi:hypothetical protein
MPVVKRLAVAALILVAGMVALGCGSSVATTKQKSTSTPTTAPSTTATSTLAPRTVPASSVPAEVACQNGQIRVSAILYAAAAGSAAETLGFVNVSDRPCTLSGYPGVAGLNAQGGQVIQATRLISTMLGGVQNGSTALPVVSLAPGQTASADVAGSDNPLNGATSCPYYPSLLVTAPNMTESTTITGVGVQGPGTSAQGFPGCSGVVIDPVVPGTTGRAN